MGNDAPSGRRDLAARLRKRLAYRRLDSAGLAVALGVLVTVLSVLSPYFFTTSNFLALGVAISLTSIMASAQTIVLVSGAIDLSITAILALSGIAAQKALAAGAPIGIIILTAVSVGAAAGLINAAVIVGVGVNPLIATIATQFMFRGVCFLWLGTGDAPYFTGTSFNYLGDGRIAGVPFPIILMSGVVLAIGAAMKFTRFGSHVYAVGGSEAAARLAGVSIGRLRTLIYVVSGISAALGGLLLTSLNGTSFPNAAQGDELGIIAAVILGGTALSGGRGSVFGTMLGVLVLGILANGLNLLGVNPFWQIFLNGAILTLAVVTDAVRNRVRER